MMSWLFFAAYIACFAVTYRIAYTYAYERSVDRWTSLGHKSAHSDGLFFGILCGVFWPLVLISMPFVFFVRAITPTPPSRRVEQLRERKAEIEKLERELGIGRHE